VLGCWAEILGETPARLDQGLFETGARSLDAMRLQAKLEQACGLELEPTFVFEFVTVRRQSDELEARGARFEGALHVHERRPGQST
jgi:acyl carrier protein